MYKTIAGAGSGRPDGGVYQLEHGKGKGAELQQVSYGDFGTPDVDELQALAKSAAEKMP